MKDNKTKEDFIELRANGLSFDKISTQISVSKPILMKWEKQFEREIDELKFLEFEALREKYNMNKKSKIEIYGELLEKARTEI